jgi:pyroglutamyl-peptidase
VLPRAATLRDGGADVLRTSLPVPHLVLALKRRGIPAYASRDAGVYLCNAVLYHSLQMAADKLRDCRVGFVHVPASLARPGGPNRGRVGACPLTWPQSVEGGLEIIAGCLGRPLPKARAHAVAGARMQIAGTARSRLPLAQP